MGAAIGPARVSVSVDTNKDTMIWEARMINDWSLRLDRTEMVAWIGT